MSDTGHDFYHAPGAPKDPGADYMVTATAMGGKVRALSVRTTNLCNEALRIHGTSPAATVALGRFMTGALLLASNLKGDRDSLTANIRSDGPIRGMTAVCDSLGNVKAYCMEPTIETALLAPGKMDISAVVGKGILTVVRDLGLKEPYVGSSELISGEIGEDFAYFLGVSEQTRSVVSLGVLVDASGVLHAGGFMVQLLPDAGDDVAEYLEKRATGGFPGITFLMSEGMNPEKILDMFLGDPEIQFLSGRPVKYACTCGRDRMERSLMALGKKDLDELASDPTGIDLECHFCGSKYHFEQTDVIGILATATGKSGTSED
ncbi:MAG: Hsp33 family molecular chaperone HslO [Clostridiaceae bacterium]|jgi:molecular chaperone Hsp33|nr:Hsp33 family molecular chaperone HslO [Oscillospiraceae bacterium]NLO63089.1 Hsp33 family molecular chaperone HslO [Clostridiaceae bacterium]